VQNPASQVVSKTEIMAMILLITRPAGSWLDSNGRGSTYARTRSLTSICVAAWGG
jgi:hypothetical protein